jgi:hypothetical protein
LNVSLLLHSLEPKPERKILEEITAMVPSVARADAAGILRGWFGIVSANLPESDALAFQAALAGIGIATDIVPDRDIPALHSDFRCQRVDLDGSSIALTTAMNRRQERSRGEMVFAAAGFLDRERMVTKSELQIETRGGARGSYNVPVFKNVASFEEKSCFRLDLFFSNDPHRISLEIDKDTVMFHGERPIRLKNTTGLTVLMCDLQALLPQERMNRGLRELSTETLYPSLQAYEEEIRWAFYRLGAKG